MADKTVIPMLEREVRLLIADHRRVSALCLEIKQERDALMIENRSLKERLRNMEGELASLQLAEALSGSGSNREKARARVNRLMREVDRCIALLNKQPLAGEQPGE